MERLLWEFFVRSMLIAAGAGAVLWALRIKTAAAKHATWTGVVLYMLLLPAWTVWGPKATLRLLPALVDKAQTPGPLPNLLIPAAESAVANSGFGWMSGVIGIYLLGMGTLLGRLLLGTVRANRLARRATDCDGRLTNASLTAPIAVGFVKPRVILPEYWSTWSQAQLDAVLIHENEHVRRHDPLVQWLALLNRAIFWFHPIAWWLERHISALAEEACDAAVLASGHDAHQYSEYLLDIARSVMQSGGRIHVLGAAMPGSFLPARLKKILEAPFAPAISRARTLSLAATSGITTVLFAAGTLDHARQPISQVITPPQAPSLEKRFTTTLAQTSKSGPIAPRQVGDAYQKWLDEEVVYIIRPEERAAFTGLKNDEERQQFIEQFWARRDPMLAGKSENAYREEHYRRIAYANDHFGFAETPGWRTDRGRIYITYGPPDESEEYTTPTPLQKWRYRYMEGIGYDVNMEFVDTAKNGQFHMTMDPNGK